MKAATFFISLFLFSYLCEAQQTVGLFSNTSNAYDGYTLFAPIKSKETYLIDNCGEKIHSWSSAYMPGLSCYLMDDGTLLRTGKIPGQGNGSGIVEMIDWTNTVIWSYSAQSTHGKQHHDIELLPNGNILLIVWDQRSQAEVIQSGSSSTTAYINSEQIIEVHPNLVSGGATVVWEWKAWDHLVQDVDTAKINYGNVALSPEKIDLNFLVHNKTDWLHFNSVSYNEKFDQIILSVHNFSELWIIDHSTTTAQAATSSGGTFGQGGDLLYRWGNPQAYNQGTSTNQKLFLQHHTHWIADSLHEAGKILVFNNQAGNAFGQNYSTVNTINLPVDSLGFYSYSGGAYLPTTFDWTYQAAVPSDFFSNIISGAQRLVNGNTLICEGVGGRFFEVDSLGTTVWEYICPVNDLGPITQNATASNNNSFRCTRYAPSYSAFNGKTLTPQGYIEIGSTFSCNLFSGLEKNNKSSLGAAFSIYPNPANDYIVVEALSLEQEAVNLKLFDVNGRCLIKQVVRFDQSMVELDLQQLNNGVFFLQLSIETEVWTEKIIITK